MKNSQWAVALILPIWAGCASDAPSSRLRGDRQIASFPEFLLSDTLVVLDENSLGSHPLYNVRSAVLTMNGVVVANSGSSEFLVVDTSTGTAKPSGRVGSGPGEFKSLHALWAKHDTLIIFDVALNKLEMFVPPFDRPSKEITLSPGPHLIAGALTTGDLVDIQVVQEVTPTAGTAVVDTAEIHSYDLAVGRGTPILRIPWRVRYGASLPNGATLALVLPLEHQGMVAVRGGAVYAASGAHWQVLKYHPSSGVVDTVFVPLPRQPLTESMVATWQNEQIRYSSEAPEVFRRYLESLPYPDSLPAFDRLVAGSNGAIWLRRFPEPASSTSVWIVSDETGSIQGTLTLPVYETVMDVGEDGLLVTLHSPIDGEETVQVYRLDVANRARDPN